MGLRIMLKEMAHFMDTREQTDRQTDRKGTMSRQNFQRHILCDLFFQLAPPPRVPYPPYIKVSPVAWGRAMPNKTSTQAGV